MTPSLRLQLLSRTTILLVATFSLAAVALYFLMRASLVAEFQHVLLTEARWLASHVELENGAIALEFDLGHLPEYSRSDNPQYFQIWNAAGKSIAKSSSLGSYNLALPENLSDHPSNQTITLPDGTHGRQVSLNCYPRPEDENEGPVHEHMLTIAVVRNAAAVDATLSTLAWLLLLVMGVTVTLSILIANRVIKRGLQPMSSLAVAIEKVGSADLAERLEIDNTPQEMTPVVMRLNELLGRLEGALTRERAFTADVAHELRTPIAGLRTAMEVCVRRPRDPNAYEKVMVNCLRTAEGMQDMVNSLLALARADAQQIKISNEPVEIDTLMRECWMPFDATAKERDVRVCWNVDSPALLALDRDKISMVFTNLFGNAIQYVCDSGWIRIDNAVRGSNLHVTLSNNGCQIKSSDAVHVFDRFWRGDTSRTDAGLHSGLGLPLSQKIVELQGGTIGVDVAENVFTVKIVFPLERRGNKSIPRETITQP